MAKILAGNSSFDVSKKDDTILLNGAVADCQLVQNPDGSYHMLLDNKSYAIDLVSKDPDTGKLVIRLNGRKVETKLHNKLAQLLESMGMEAGKKKLKDLKAPMPGLVLDVVVQDGTEVSEGDDLLILEAMKMENAIKSPQDGVVDSISVQKGDKVDKNQTLITFV